MCENEDGPAREAACEMGTGSHKLCRTHPTCEGVVNYIQDLRQVVCNLTKRSEEQHVKIREVDKLRGAIRRAGFAVCQTSGEWTIHDISEAALAEQAKTVEVISQNVELEVKVQNLTRQLDNAIQERDALLDAMEDVCLREDRLRDCVEEMRRTLEDPSRKLSEVTQQELAPWLPMIQAALAPNPPKPPEAEGGDASCQTLGDSAAASADQASTSPPSV